jgi:hypothetical protein
MDRVKKAPLPRKSFYKLESGGGYERGFTLLYILKRILAHSEGVSEPTLREELRDELGIRLKKNVKRHLDTLKKEGLIFVKAKKGKPNVWKIKKSFETLKKLDERFCPSEYATDYIKSECTQEMIAKDLGSYLKALELFDESQLTKILTLARISPSALNVLLNVDELLEEKNLANALEKIRRKGGSERLDAIRERVFSAVQIALAYDGVHERAVSEEFNQIHFDIKTTLIQHDSNQNPVTLPEAHVEYWIPFSKETIEEKKLELKRARGEKHADNP